MRADDRTGLAHFGTVLPVACCRLRTPRSLRDARHTCICA
jgi:hypothetical protein